MQKSMGGENVAVDSSFLGLDFGHSKIGLAVADGETRMAFALGVLKNDQNFFAKLQEIVTQKGITKIIVGLTKHSQDLEGGMEKEAFGRGLEEKLGVPVEFADEMFTTKMAQENLKLRGGKNLSQFDDQEAARIILQSWLDK